jgi:hypothetical protein
MDVDDGMTTVQLLIHGKEAGVTKPLITVTRKHTNAVGMERIERIRDLLKCRVDMRHGDRREHSKATKIFAGRVGGVLIA